MRQNNFIPTLALIISLFNAQPTFAMDPVADQTVQTDPAANQAIEANPIIATTASNLNPLLEIAQLPNFQEINLANYSSAMRDLIQTSEEELTKNLQQPVTWETTIQPLYEDIANITRLWNLLNILNNYTHTEQTQKVYEEVLPEVTKYFGGLKRNQNLYNAYVKIKNSTDFGKLTPTQQIAINQAILDFHLNGANLNATQQQDLMQTVQRLQSLAQQFSQNLYAASSSWQYFVAEQDSKKVAGIPNNIKNQAANIAEKMGQKGWLFTLDLPVLIAIESYAKDRELREAMYTAYATLPYDNDTIILETLKARQKLAQTLGYTNYATYAVADRLPPKPEKTLQFLEQLAEKVKPLAQKEFLALQKAAQEDGVQDLKPWDSAYYAQLAHDKIAKDSQTKSKQYFNAQQVVTGLLNLNSILFNVQFQEVKPTSTWHPSVKLYVMTDAKNNNLGYFYLDLFARNNKRPFAATDVYTTRLYAKQQILPVTIVSTNFTTEAITHRDVRTLFEQFGNMLARNLAQMDYSSMSNTTGMMWDAINFSGMTMQHFAWELKILQDIVKQQSSKNALPSGLFDDLYAAYKYDAAINLINQLQTAMFDLRIHLNLPADQDKTALQIYQDIQDKYGVLPRLPNDNAPARLNDIFTTENAGLYYTSCWTQVLSSDAFAAFKQDGLFSASTGHDLRDAILFPAGQASILDLFVKFRGRDPETTYLLQDLGID